MGWYETAYYAAYKARQLNPEDERAYYQEALALYNMGQLAHASEAIAQAEQQLGARDPALLMLRSLIALAEDNPRHALLISAAIPPDAVEYPQALELGMRCALQLSYLDEIAIHRDALDSAGMADRALSLLLDALPSYTSAIGLEMLIIVCETAVMAGEFVTALEYFEAWQVRTTGVQKSRLAPQIKLAMLRKHRPRNPQQRVALGILLAHLGKPYMAIRHLQRGLAALPDSVAGWRALARMSTEVGRFRDAEYATRQVTLLVPSDAAGWLAWAEAALRSGDYEQALYGLQRFHALGRESAVSLFMQGAALAGLERWSAAIRQFDRALALNPQFSVAWWNQCLCLARVKRFEEARRAMMRARTLDSRMWERAPYDTPPFVPYPILSSAYRPVS